MKRIVWTVLAALVSAGSAALAMRALNYVWRKATHEPPPAQPTWARLLLGGPLKKGVERVVEPTAI